MKKKTGRTGMPTSPLNFTAYVEDEMIMLKEKVKKERKLSRVLLILYVLLIA